MVEHVIDNVLYTVSLPTLGFVPFILLVIPLETPCRDDIFLHGVITVLPGNRRDTRIVHIHALSSVCICLQTIMVIIASIGQVNSADKCQFFIDNHTFLMMRKHHSGFRARTLNIKSLPSEMGIHRSKYPLCCRRIGFYL